MANATITPNQLAVVLRLHKQGFGKKRIVEYTGISKTTIKKYIERFKLINELDETNANFDAPSLYNKLVLSFVKTNKADSRLL